MSYADFKIDPSDYKGNKYEAFKTRLITLSIQRPEEYSKLREAVLFKMRQQTSDNVYNQFYNLLTEGKNEEGSGPLIGAGAPTGFVGGAEGWPKRETIQLLNNIHYPKQKVTDIAMKASLTMDELVEEAVSIILPYDPAQIAFKRMGDREKGTRGFAPPDTA